MGQAVKPLDRQGFLRRNVREVELPDGNVVCIRPLSAGYLVRNTGADGKLAEKAFSAESMFVESLTDADGNRLFGPEEKDAALTIDVRSFQVLLDAILDLNGLRPVMNADAPEDAAKN